MDEMQNTASGERLSFYQLFKNKNYQIEIPIIQRDYAQGRKTAFDVRNTFLEALKKYLIEGKPNRDLDFIYGSLLKNNDDKVSFVPLDGQQRLTTLFLLHWYLANKDGEADIFKQVFAFFINDNKTVKSKFTYKTRTSASEFCDKIVNFKVDINNLSNSNNNETPKISEIIKNQAWYFLSWKNDPTIQSMLIMLDAIHEKFFDTANLFSSLIDNEKPIITFQFLKLEEFGLTDDLYIKMNARGKPLSPFENFKAKLEQHIDKSKYNLKLDYTILIDEKIEKVSVQEYFSNKIDTNWANLFWAYSQKYISEKKDKKHRQNKVSHDDIIMNFINAVSINNIATKKDKAKDIKKLINTNAENLSFNLLEKFLDKRLVTSIIDLLDLLENGNNTAKKFLDNFFYYDENIFEQFLIKDFKTAEYEKRIMFFAFSQYIIKWKKGNKFSDIVGLKKWLRIIHNLTENTGAYNDETQFSNSIQSIEKILEYSNDIHTQFLKLNKIKGFDPKQIEEEKIKILLIQRNNKWEDILLNAEQHGYFKGQIIFLLRLCGIEDYYIENKKMNWNETDDEKYRLLFADYFNKAKGIFNDKGLKESLSKKGNYIWERALLSTGYFLISEGRNQSFLINKDRDISWKRLLKADKKKEKHSKIISSIFNKINAKDIPKSLNEIIDDYKNDNWRSKFIRNPDLFRYLGTYRYIRKDSDYGFLLLKSIMISGKYTELYSHALYEEFLKEKEFAPFKKTAYNEKTRSNPQPYASIEEWVYKNDNYKIELYYENNNSNFLEYPYEIRFYIPNMSKSEIDYPDEIKTILKNNSLIWKSESEWTGFWISNKNELDIISIIIKLCNELNAI